MKHLSVVRLIALLLLATTCGAATASVIHWELRGIEGYYRMPDQLPAEAITGGFDFDTATGTFSNITFRTDAGFAERANCFPCANFTGKEAYLNGPDTILLSERFFYEGLERHYTAMISGLDPRVPGTLTAGLRLDENGYVELPDNGPFWVPSISVSEACFECMTAFGSVVPEPEAWAMLLAGFGLFGYAMRYQRRAV